MRSFVFIERVSEVTDVFARERGFREVNEMIARDAGVADVSGYTDYGRVWTELRALIGDELGRRSTLIILGDARTNGRDPRVDELAALDGVRGAHHLAEPGTAPLLELRGLRDRRLRTAVRGIRMLDRAAARGVRQAI